MNSKNIRKRKSYQIWDDLFQKFILEKIVSDKTIGLCLLNIYDMLDKYYAFGSQQRSRYAEESLRQLLLDKHLLGECNCELQLKCTLLKKCILKRNV